MQKDAIIQELTDPKGSKKGVSKAMQSKLALELKEREKEIRELKNKMGFLRKENVQLKRDVEKIDKSKLSTVIPITREQKPINSLVAELQDTIGKLRSENNRLKKEKTLY